jgi:hypothetical protein
VSALWTGITGATGWPGNERVAPRPAQRLRAVPAARPRLARRPFALVLIVLFAVGLTGLLMLNTTLQNQAFTARTLNRQATELAHVQADLQTRLDAASSPQELVRRATLLGMRPNQYPAFLVLPSGKVIGKPERVSGREAENLLYKTDAQISQERADALAKHEAKVARRAAAVRSRTLRDQAQAVEALEQRLRAAQEAKANQSAKKADSSTGKKGNSSTEKEKAVKRPAEQSPGRGGR